MISLILKANIFARMTTYQIITKKSNLMSNPRKKTAKKQIDLALQGGGAHGAFTWGVLDRLVEDESIDIFGVSGTSAGAMNAAVMASGYAIDGRSGARDALAKFWKDVSKAAITSPFKRTPLDLLFGRWTLENSPLFQLAEFAGRMMSPYDIPFDIENPLKPILEKNIDFDALKNGPIKVFVTATNVRTGRGRVFRGNEISSDVLLASACLPTLFKSVFIDGEPYWDGGYSGNPTLTPLIRECDSDDTILVQINPIERQELPTRAYNIISRLNEISFNAVLQQELRMMSLLRRATPTDDGEGGLWGRQRLHRISSDLMLELGYSSKLNAEWKFLSMLHAEGRRAAEDFLSVHGDKIGIESTLDIDELLGGVDEL